MSGTRVALFVPQFPPTRGGGVARAQGTTRYLTRMGFRLSVWTRPCEHTTSRDGIPIHSVVPPDWPNRAPWWISTGIPDPLCYCAVKMAWQARREPFQVVYTSGPFHSVHWAGYLLKLWCGVPWVMEYRDTWTTNFLYGRTGRWKRVDQILESRFARAADRIVSVTPFGAGSLSRRFGPKVRYIPNGYDPEEFVDRPPYSPNSLPRLIFAGALSPLRELEPLARAMEVLETPCELALIGPVEEQEFGPATERLIGAGRIKFEGVRSHRETLRSLAKADALVHLGEAQDRHGESVAGKLYEYIAAGRPILSVVNRGDATNMLRLVPQSRCVAPGDVEGIRKALEDMLQSPQPSMSIPPDIQERHAYPQIAKKLGSLFQELV